jgi:hypothetical protein
MIGVARNPAYAGAKQIYVTILAAEVNASERGQLEDITTALVFDLAGYDLHTPPGLPPVFQWLFVYWRAVFEVNQQKWINRV